MKTLSTKEAVAYLARHNVKMTERRLRALAYDVWNLKAGVARGVYVAGRKRGQRWYFTKQHLYDYIAEHGAPHSTPLTRIQCVYVLSLLVLGVVVCVLVGGW